MSDLIDRQAAIEAVSKGCQEWRGIFGRCEDNLLALPSAQPEQKIGHWKEDWLASTSCGAYQVWRCSECKNAFNWRMKYCGHCGARMEDVK